MTVPDLQTAEGRRAWLMSLPPAERLAVYRRWEIDEPRHWGPVPTRPATAEELERLGNLPPIERLALARCLGIE